MSGKTIPGKPENEVQTPVEILPSGEVKQPQPAVEVELDAVTGKPIEAAKPSEPSISAEEFRKMQARYEYQSRQFEKTQRELQDELARMRSVQRPVEIQTEKTEDDKIYGLSKKELNQIGAEDWTKPVQMMAEKIAEKKAQETFRTLMAEQERVRQEQVRTQTTQGILEREKNWVLEKEPSLNDETSTEFNEFYKTYNRMIQEDPTLVQNPRAPRLVYYEWKSEKSKPQVQNILDPEQERLRRVAGGQAPIGRSTTKPGTIKLTQEELDFCNNKGISPAVYAKMKDSNFREGVSA